MGYFLAKPKENLLMKTKRKTRTAPSCIHICCGKGGVGKTLNAVAMGLALADKGEKTAIIDYDGGHSVPNTLSLDGTLPFNVITEVKENLSVVIIGPHEFHNILKSKKLRWSFGEYLDQFPKDLGIIPFADMLHHFFGAPTDVATLEKFSILVGMLAELADDGFTNIIIDVEPTAGLERLLLGAESMIRSLRNLKGKGKIFLGLIGVKWPDIKGYLDGEFIANIDEYADRIADAVEMIRGANYYIVCTPERGPVGQTAEVERIISNFGGTARAYIVNNMRGEEHETIALAPLEERRSIPLVRIPHMSQVHTGEDISPSLVQAGFKTLLAVHLAQRVV
jgi:anion-transporting  ArsA/GET3 family ATPase